MKPELQNKLIEEYPVLFQDRHKPMTQSLMCFGCEFGDGWYNIFDDLCHYLTVLSKGEQLVKLKPELETKENYGYMYLKNPTISFTQVKEKYGTMRVYWIGNGVEGDWDEIKSKFDDSVNSDKLFSKYYDRVENAIDFTEFLSGKICEECGESGKVYTNGWCVSRCKKHAIEHYGFDPDEDLNEKIVKL
jgi:hypothetical protein